MEVLKYNVCEEMKILINLMKFLPYQIMMKEVSKISLFELQMASLSLIILNH